MADIIVRTRADRAKVVEFMRSLPGVLSGRLPDRLGIAKACQAKLIAAALKDVHDDFGKKSAGGVGDDGTAWEPLHPYTIRERSKQGGTSGQPGRKAITQQDYQWLRHTKRDIYYRELRRLLDGGVRLKEAQRQAAIISRFMTQGAWKARNKALGLVGKAGIAANPEDFPILDDTGRLKASVEPGTASGTGLNASYHEGGRATGDQVVTYGRGFVMAESNVPYGDPHMRPYRGSKTGGYRPARPWKFPEEVPDAWVERWAHVFADAIQECVVQAVAQM